MTDITNTSSDKTFLNYFTYESIETSVHGENIFINCTFLRDMKENIRNSTNIKYKKGDIVKSISIAISFYTWDSNDDLEEELYEVY